jgi:hypothetical protein
MTKEQVQTLPTNELRAILRSTNPAGKFWLEMVWASDEMDRRSRRRQAFGRACAFFLLWLAVAVLTLVQYLSILRV